jgi:hypothetical protein
MVADVGAFPSGGFPHFTSDTNRVFFHDGTALVSVAWDGSDRKVVLARAAPQRFWRRWRARAEPGWSAAPHLYV